MLPGVPQVAGAVPIRFAANSVPVARGIHALAAIVGGGHQIVGPEEVFRRIVDQHRIVRDGAPVVVEIVRTLSVGVVGAAVDRQISAVVDGEMVLVEMLMFGEVGAAVELDPGRVRFPAIAHHQVSYAGEITLPRQLVFVWPAPDRAA